MFKKQLISQQQFALAFVVVAVSLVLVACVRPDQSTNQSQKPSVPGGAVAVIDSDIIINTPISATTIENPVTVAGRTRINQEALGIRLSDSQRNIIATTSAVTVPSAGVWSSYSVDFEYPVPSTSRGFLEVYARGVDGGEVDVIEIPVNFSKYDLPTVEVFFSNVEEDPDLLACDVVYPVKRSIARADQKILLALTGLVQGPTENEQKKGFISSIPEGDVEVQDLSLKEGVMTVDFSQALQEGVAGSCRVQAIRAQIVQTLLQFEGIDEVVITIDGEERGILQP